MSVAGGECGPAARPPPLLPALLRGECPRPALAKAALGSCLEGRAEPQQRLPLSLQAASIYRLPRTAGLDICSLINATNIMLCFSQKCKKR